MSKSRTALAVACALAVAHAPAAVANKPWPPPQYNKMTEVEQEVAYSSSLLFGAPWNTTYAHCGAKRKGTVRCRTWWTANHQSCSIRWRVTRKWLNTSGENCRLVWWEGTPRATRRLLGGR